HLYNTDYYHESAFRTNQQILSIYYLVKPLEEISVPLRDKEFDFDEEQLKIYNERNEIETFRFINWDDFSEDTVSLPIDKIVARMLKEKAHPDLPSGKATNAQP